MLDRFNPKGVPGQVMGNSTGSGTRCTVCGLVLAPSMYTNHLHVNVEDVSAPSEVSVIRWVAVSVALLARVVWCSTCVQQNVRTC
jgi:hypothetical protein